MSVFFLHGFLGRPADWEITRQQLALPFEASIHAPDYLNESRLGPEIALRDWGSSFNEFVRKKGGTRNILVGYSLGGRLALQAVTQDPELWSHTVCISTNPGFNDDCEGLDGRSAEREKRWLNDCYWAEQFRTGSWENVLKAWNAQPVFGGGHKEPLRDEAEYRRELLGLALTNWSLAQQPNLRPLLATQAKKVSWIVGAKDEKFFRLGQELQKEIPEMQVYAIPDASHRVIFDRPRDLAFILGHLIKNCPL